MFFCFNSHWDSYVELLETNFFPFLEKIDWVKILHSMQYAATSHRTEDVLWRLFMTYIKMERFWLQYN